MRPLLPGRSARRILLRQLPWLLLAVMLGLTWFAWDHERQLTRSVLRSQFDFALRETVSRIEQRAQGYEQMLRGVQSLYATTSLGQRAALHDYVEALQLNANFSGVQAIGVVEWVPEPLRSGHLAAMRAAGLMNYAIQPEGLREVYTPIVQREPSVGRNRAAPGVDVWIDPVRRAALERSRDSGQAAISGKVALKVDNKDLAPPGFVLYLPIYAPGQVHDNVAQRRASLLGWVYASFHMDDFMASLYGSQPPGLAFAVHDGTDDNAASLLYGADPGAAANAAESTKTIGAKEYMVVAGHSWTLSLRTRDAFQRQFGRSMEVEIALAGLLLSVVVAMLAWQMINGREHALALAAAMTEELRHMAQHDTLTGLPNRALFSDRFKQELAHARRQNTYLALIFIDLDNFKDVNDHFGHAGGDEVLRRVAAQLRHSVRAADSVGRIGGDEFVVLLAQLNASDPILELADKIRQAVKQPLLLAGDAVHISCSMGIAVYPKDGADEEALTRKADEAMYQAKAAGRDRIRESESGR